MARIAVLGANGMLGHMASRHLARSNDVIAIQRRKVDAASAAEPSSVRWETGIDVREPGVLAGVLSRHRPDFVLNCVGLIKQRPEAGDVALAIELNALLPHRLAGIAGEIGAKLIQVSTDCVFSGRRGHYNEDDEPDPVDTYGRTKWLGEVTDPPHLTIRTSIIGPQLEGQEGLVAWFLSQAGRPVNGFRRAIFSGLTTRALVGTIGALIERRPDLTGLYHVASESIDKFDLLTRLAGRIGWTTPIVPVDLPVIDRSLDGSRFRQATGIETPSWDDMLDELASELKQQACSA